MDVYPFSEDIPYGLEGDRLVEGRFCHANFD